MKKVLLLPLLLFLSLTLVKAAPGDTTWVQAHSGVQLSYYNNYDTTIEFPKTATTYRKILMIFTLGKYPCPSGSTYCGDWDYTVQNFLMSKSGDTVELGRLITPYANVSYTRFPWSWKERYVFDVTDYAPLLKDSNTVRILYSGYSGGFTADIKFAMIEGTPERNVLDIDRVWHGSFTYGGTTPIGSYVTPLSLTAPSGTSAAAFKFNITGHGADGTGCSEFCKKYYEVYKNTTLVEKKDIWRADCGQNNLYPQSGTWTFDRGNWCPGALVRTNVHPLPSMAAGAFDLKVNFENYSGSGSAIYTIDGAVFYYGAMNKTLDASLEDIIAPTNYEGNYRENPRVGLTTVRVKNTGSTPITALDFQYGVTGQPLTTHTWTGTIAPLESAVIDLPNAASLTAASGTNIPYEVTILKVNTVTDDDATNNKQVSEFTAAPVWSTKLIFTFKTNGSTVGSVSETEWKIYNSAGVVVAQRVNNAPTTTYKDTVTLPPDTYKFVMTDAGCDGISYWYYVNYPVNPGTGSLQVRTLASPLILKVNGLLSGDFGCGFTHYFTTAWPTGIEETATEPATVQVFPNPASDKVTISIGGIQPRGNAMIYNSIGQLVQQLDISQEETNVSVASFAPGIYHVVFQPEQEGMPHMRTKLLIVK